MLMVNTVVEYQLQYCSLWNIKEVIMNLHLIDKWFENYDKWVNQAQRANRLGIYWEQEDKILNTTYYSLTDLDLKAEEMKVKYKEEEEKLKQKMIEWRKSKGLEV
jgi:hypothetical protein